MRTLLREVFDEAGRIGLRWYERLVLVCLAALLLVLGKRVGEVIVAALKNAKPQAVADENGPQREPSEPDPEATDPRVSGRPDERDSGSGG